MSHPYQYFNNINNQKKVSVWNHSKQITFWAIVTLYQPSIFALWTSQHYKPFQSFYLQDCSRNFSFWTIQEFSIFRQFHNLVFLDNSWFVILWTIPKNFLLDRSRIFTFRNLTEFPHSRPFQKYHICDHSRIVNFWTLPDLILWLII